MKEKNKNHSEETKLKISNVLKGKIPWNKGLTKDTSDIINNSAKKQKGRIVWNKGLTKDTNHIVNNLANKRKGQVAWNKNIKHSEETILKISNSLKGHVSWNKGKKHSDEIKLKMKKNHWSKKGIKPWNTGLKKENNSSLMIISNKLKNREFSLYARNNMSIAAKKRDPLTFPDKKSKSEKILFNRVNDIYKGISKVKNNFCINRYKPDCIIEKFNLILEYDGVYWHSDINRDLERDKKLVTLGYKVIHYRGYNPDDVEIMTDVDYMLEHETNGLYKENEKIILNIN